MPVLFAGPAVEVAVPSRVPKGKWKRQYLPRIGRSINGLCSGTSEAGPNLIRVAAAGGCESQDNEEKRAEKD
jgi:hypothetical protein